MKFQQLWYQTGIRDFKPVLTSTSRSLWNRIEVYQFLSSWDRWAHSILVVDKGSHLQGLQL